MPEEIAKIITEAMPVVAPILIALIVAILSLILTWVRKLLSINASAREHALQMGIIEDLVESVVAELEVSLVKKLKRSKTATDKDGRLTPNAADSVKKAAVHAVRVSMPKKAAKMLKKTTKKPDVYIGGLIEKKLAEIGPTIVFEPE